MTRVLVIARGPISLTRCVARSGEVTYELGDATTFGIVTNLTVEDLGELLKVAAGDLAEMLAPK